MARNRTASIAGSVASANSLGLVHRQPVIATTAGHEDKNYKPEQFTQPFCDFMRQCPTVFHVVDYCKARLDAGGFEEVSPTIMSSF